MFFRLMGIAKFYGAIRDSEIASTEYPVTGVNVLLPYGKAIANRLESLVLSEFRELGYSEIDLPGVLPHDFVSHLRTDELFKAGNDSHSFYLACGSEAQAVFVANTLIKSHRDLPLRIYSGGKNYRQCTRVPLIKDLELRQFEFHAFFDSKEAAFDEAERALDVFSRQLSQFRIPFIKARDGLLPNDQTKLYAYFPVSSSFGSVFCVSVLDGKFSHLASWDHLVRGSERITPFHVNFSFTHRLLSAYLANTYDEKGFNLDPDVCPYAVFLNTASFKDDELSYVMAALDQSHRSYLRKHINNNGEALRRFLLSGIPVYVGSGQHNLKMRSRVNSSFGWIAPGDFGPALDAALAMRQVREPAQIRAINIGSPSETILTDGVVYLTPAKNMPLFSGSGLKNLGYVGSDAVAMTMRRY